MSTTTTEQVTPAEVTTTVKAAILKRLKTSATALNKAEQDASQAVRLAGLTSLQITLLAYVAFAADLVLVAKEMGDEALHDLSGNTVFDWLKLHIAPADWGSLPTGSATYVRTIQVSKWHTAETYKAFEQTDNEAGIATYCSFLQVNATGKFGNKSDWDVRKSLVDPSDWDETANGGKGAAKSGAKFGTLVKKLSAGRGSNTPSTALKVPEALAKLLKMDRAKLAQVETVAEVAMPDDETADAFCLQVVAAYMLRHNKSVVVPGVTITLK